MKKIKALAIAAISAAALLSGCANTGPRGLNLYVDDMKLDEGLIKGTNTVVDLNKLSNPDTSDQAALELIGTTQYKVIVNSLVDYLRANPNPSPQSIQAVERVKSEIARKQSRFNVDDMLQASRGMDVPQLIEMQNWLGSGILRKRTFGLTNADVSDQMVKRLELATGDLSGRLTSDQQLTPLKYQDGNLMTAWSVLGWALVDARSIFSGQGWVSTSSDNLNRVDLKFVHDPFFQFVGCASYFPNRSKLRQLSELYGSEKLGQAMQSYKDFGTVKKREPVNRERCSAIYQSLPAALEPVKKLKESR